MFNSKSKKAGFFCTLFFHLGVFLICFFSSIGYTSVEVPRGIEIQFVPYQELNPVEEVKEKTNNTNSAKSESNNDNILEKIILEQNEIVNIPNDQDTLTLTEIDNNNQSFSISSEFNFGNS